MRTHSSILAWRIPWTEEPGGLQPLGSQRVGHDCSNLARTQSMGYRVVIQSFKAYVTFVVIRYWLYSILYNISL